MLTTVAIFEKPWEAELLRLRLAAEGIAAFIQFENHVGVNWLTALALGGMRLQVLDEQVADALSVVERCRAGEFSAELQEMFGDLDEPAAR